jgi:hypothetical protein
MDDQADKLATPWQNKWLDTTRRYLFMDLDELMPAQLPKRNRAPARSQWMLRTGGRDFDSSGACRPRKRKRKISRGLLWVPA